MSVVHCGFTIGWLPICGQNPFYCDWLYPDQYIYIWYVGKEPVWLAAMGVILTWPLSAIRLYLRCILAARWEFIYKTYGLIGFPQLTIFFALHSSILWSEHPIITCCFLFSKTWPSDLKKKKVVFRCSMKLSGFISLLFDLSSKIQGLDFVKDVNELLNPLQTLLCHPSLWISLSVFHSPSLLHSFF